MHEQDLPPPPASPLTPGALLDSRYTILQYLGEGGMGVVYKARDTVLDEIVAIKVLRPNLLGAADVRQRFLSESKLARRVSHKNVCRIHDYGEDGPLGYISMQFVEGAELKTLARQAPGLTVDEAVDIAVQLADGLQAIHDEGIVHRDFKCANVMVDERGHARLMDFGIAKLWDLNAGAGLTLEGLVTGTPEYMSPEQASGEPLDPRSDIYSLGVVLFELFTGTRPFMAESAIAVLHKHLHEEPPLDAPVAARIPPIVKPIIRKAMAKRREDRYASAEEVKRALLAARTALSTAASDTTETLVRKVEAVRPAASAPVSASGAAVPAGGTATRSAARWLLASAAVLVLIGIIAAAAVAYRSWHAVAPPASASRESAPAAAQSGGTERPSTATHQQPSARENAGVPAKPEPAPPGAAETAASGEAGAPCGPGHAAACESACDQGDAGACTRLGVLYNAGTEVSKDLPLAASYYERGCRGGDMAGCNNLGTLYQYGALGFRNRSEAASLYDQACRAGHMDACANLGVLYQEPGASARERTLARELLRKACDAGVPRACAGAGG